MEEKIQSIQELKKRYIRLANKMMYIGAYHLDYDIDEFYANLKVSYKDAIDEYLEEGLEINGYICLSQAEITSFETLLLDESFSYNEKCRVLKLPWLGITEDDSRKILKTVWEIIGGTANRPFPPDVKL